MERALDLAQTLAFVRGEGGDEDEADDVRGIGRGVRDHRTSVRVADREDRARDLLEIAGEVGGVERDAAQRVRRAPSPGRPAACSRSITPFQLEASAKAPWTRTTVSGEACRRSVC